MSDLLARADAYLAARSDIPEVHPQPLVHDLAAALRAGRAEVERLRDLAFDLADAHASFDGIGQILDPLHRQLVELGWEFRPLTEEGRRTDNTETAGPGEPWFTTWKLRTGTFKVEI